MPGRHPGNGDRVPSELCFSAALADEVGRAAGFVVNLECALTQGDARGLTPGLRFAAEPAWAATLRDLGITCVSLANNHIMDAGVEGFWDTLDSLQGAGVDSFGYRRGGTAANDYVIEAGGKKVGFLSFTNSEFSYAELYDGEGAVKLDPIEVFYGIEKVKAEADVVVLLLHIGNHFESLPSPFMRRISTFAIDCGADLVLCQHSHTVGLVETYKQGTIVYGQGHLAFPAPNADPRWTSGSLVRLDVRKAEPAVEVVYLKREGAEIARVDSNRAPAHVVAAQEIFDDPARYEQYWAAKAQRIKESFLPLLMPLGGSRVHRLARRVAGRLRLDGLADGLVSARRTKLVANYLECEDFAPLLSRELKRAG